MALFTSSRERALWLWAAAVLAAIYSTVALAGRLAELLRRQNLMGITFAVAFVLLIVVIVRVSVRRRPGRHEIWAAIGVAAVYGMAFSRMGVAAERTHLVEYGLLAVLVYQALLERRDNGGGVRRPALLAVVATGLLGWLDEGIQSQVPGRVYDRFDVVVNVLSAVMAVSASVVMAWARRKVDGSSDP